MGKLATMVSEAVIDGFKGTIDFYVYKGMPCFRRWPKKRGGQFTPQEMAGWTVFTQAAALWNELSPEVRLAYEEMAVTTNLTAKDMFFRGYISGILRYYWPVDELSEINV